MFRAIRPVGHEDHLSLVEHLDELRTRLFICLAALAVAFAFCFWQNHALLRIVGNPYAKETRNQVTKCQGELGPVWCADQAVKSTGLTVQALLKVLDNPSSGLNATLRRELKPFGPQLTNDLAKLPKNAPSNNLVTLGIGEPFTATITVIFYFSLLLSLPVILFELYGFLVPAFSPTERRVAMPVMLAIPGLFACGVAFGYFVVLPAAVHFLQNFNSGIVRAVRAGDELLPVRGTDHARDGRDLPGPARGRRRRARGNRDAAAATQEPPLRDRRRRGDRGVAAG